MKHLLSIVPILFFVACSNKSETGINIFSEKIIEHKEDTIIIDGYSNNFSYYSGDTMELYINAKQKISKYNLNIHDINGNIIGSLNCDVGPQSKPSETSYESGYNYKITFKGSIPKLKSGVYLFANKIPFLVKSQEACDILILYSSNTENAYSNSGGKSLYSYNSSEQKASPIVSFHRPIPLPGHSTEFLQWINTVEGLNIGYLADKDMDDYKNIKNSNLLLIPGHSEYWSIKARRNFDKFIANGNNSLIMSGNTMWWQVRYNDDYSKLICHKSSAADPIKNEFLKTINWSDSILNYPIINSIGLDFNYGGMGTLEDKGWDGFKIVQPLSPLLENCDLKLNETISLRSTEYDGTLLSFSNDSTEVELSLKNLFFRYELIAFDFASRFEDKNRNGCFVVMQKNQNSGLIVNTGSTDWCRIEGMKGKDSDIIKLITLNSINLLLDKDKDKLFTTKPKLH